MATNLETAMNIADEEDLWIGDSGDSSHMMGSEEHALMLCEEDINVDVITKNGDVTSGTLRVKAIPGMKQKLYIFTQAMLGGWTMHGGQAKQVEVFIALTHEDHKPIIYDIVLMAGNSILFAAKISDQESKRGHCSDCKWKTIKQILPQSNRTCWTSFDGLHSKIIQG